METYVPKSLLRQIEKSRSKIIFEIFKISHGNRYFKKEDTKCALKLKPKPQGEPYERE